MRRILFALVLLLAACAPGAADAPVATLTLIPATATSIPSPVPPSLTPAASLVAPDQVTRLTPLAPTAEATLVLHGEELVEQDPAAAEMVTIARRLVQQQSDLPTTRIRLVDIYAVVWTDSSLNCPLPDSEVIEQNIDGYRIVLVAGEQEYIFHTDVDRIVPCAAENEQLPPGLLPTEEATAEVTADATEEATSETTPEAAN